MLSPAKETIINLGSRSQIWQKRFTFFENLLTSSNYLEFSASPTLKTLNTLKNQEQAIRVLFREMRTDFAVLHQC